jgi:ribonuclease HI
MKLIINTDGGARGNPGPAGIGVVIADENQQIIGRHKQYIGEATNNVAEYKALILALTEAQRVSNLEPSTLHLEIRMDSELIVRQMQGRYKIKEPTLKLLAGEVLILIKHFKNVTFHHVPREQNKEADKLVNQAIDAAI